MGQLKQGMVVMAMRVGTGTSVDMDGSSMVPRYVRHFSTLPVLCDGCSSSLRTTRRHIVPPRVRRPSDAGALNVLLGSGTGMHQFQFLEPASEQNLNGASTGLNVF